MLSIWHTVSFWTILSAPIGHCNAISNTFSSNIHVTKYAILGHLYTKSCLLLKRKGELLSFNLNKMITLLLRQFHSVVHYICYQILLVAVCLLHKQAEIVWKQAEIGSAHFSWHNRTSISYRNGFKSLRKFTKHSQSRTKRRGVKSSHEVPGD